MHDHLRGLVGGLDTQRIRQGAVRLLVEVGMAVPAAAVARRLQAAGMDRVCVSTGEKNEAARALYESVGFRIQNGYLDYRRGQTALVGSPVG